MEIVHLELFKNLADTSGLSGLNRVMIKSDLNSQEPMELSHIGDFEFYLESQMSSIY
jgi:hypothetical protein